MLVRPTSVRMPTRRVDRRNIAVGVVPQLACLLGVVLSTTLCVHEVAAGATGETVGDRLWMWAHPAGFHDNYFHARKFGPQKNEGGYRSRITPVEAAVRLDLHNIMFVYEKTDFTRCERGTPNATDGADPIPCYPQSAASLPQYMMPFDSPFFKQVAFSVSGGGVGYPDGYIDALLEQLPHQSNSVGVLYDDFVYSNAGLQMLQNMSARVGGKDIFLCLYTKELLGIPPNGLLPYFKHATRPMLWMADLNQIRNLTHNWGLLESVIAALPQPERGAMKPMLGAR